jgi:FMN phosphatase YigB (HAD superfamily)
MTEANQNRRPDTKRRKYAAVIFDLDGTILDRPSAVPQKANLAALKLLCSKQYSIATLEEKLKHVYTLTTRKRGSLVPKREQFALLLRTLDTAADNLVEKLFQEFLRRYLSLVDIFADALDTLTKLSQHGIRIGLATNGPEDVVNEVIKHFNLHDVLDFTVASSQAGSPKPSILYSDFLIKKAEVEPRRILIVGDGEEDAMTAEMIGAEFILVNRGQHIIQKEINSLRIVHSLKEIVTTCLNSSYRR